jgi:hypothetical protein
MQINSGASVTTTTVDAGARPDSPGGVIDIAGGSLTAESGNIGGRATASQTPTSGRLTIRNGGSAMFALSGGLAVWQDSVVEYSSGTFQAGLLDLAGGQVLLSPGSNKVMEVRDILWSEDAQSFIDLADNEMLIHQGDPAAVTDLLQSGHAGGAWNGGGIHSSSAADQPGRALGLQETDDGLRVAFTWAGDINLDGKVDIADLGILAANWQQSDRFWWQGDANYDSQVNIADLGILAANWQKGAGAPPVSFEQAMAMFDVFNGIVIPEPAAACLVAVAGLLAIRRR